MAKHPHAQRLMTIPGLGPFGAALLVAEVHLRLSAASHYVQVRFREGLVLNGGGGLGDIPIIDWRA